MLEYFLVLKGGIIRSRLLSCLYTIELMEEEFYIEYSFTYGNTHRTSKLLERV